MLPELLQAQLAELGLNDFSEVALREALEKHVETYTLQAGSLGIQALEVSLSPYDGRYYV